jgi:hypothetical protein
MHDLASLVQIQAWLRMGAGLPGLIAALGGLVTMARRRRKQLA